MHSLLYCYIILLKNILSFQSYQKSLEDVPLNLLEITKKEMFIYLNFKKMTKFWENIKSKCFIELLVHYFDQKGINLYFL